MAKTIWKFPAQDSWMPKGAKILCVMMQDCPRVWVEVDDEAPLVERKIRVTGTGWPAESGEYIGSVIEGPFVWHYYDQGEVSHAD